ncbi:MAG: hypothetical protein IJ088_16250 [Clostridia bacterium]|nr:hypothetical protein [Clostridia bacterium]
MGYLNFTGLSRFLGKIQERLNGKVNISQGEDYEDCYLVVNETGDLELRDVPITLGIPGEWDRFGYVRINKNNCTQSLFTVTMTEQGAVFEPDCVYACSAHLYGAGEEFESDISFCMYTETEAETDKLMFTNHVLMTGAVFKFYVLINLVTGSVRVYFSTTDAQASVESLFTSGTLSRLDFIIRKVQKEPY